MYYSSIGILAILILFINNFYILTNWQSVNSDLKKVLTDSQKAYKRFLLGVCNYYIVDILWAPFYYFVKKPILSFIETSIYFVFMALAVMLWTQYVIVYLNKKNKAASILKFIGRFFLIAQIIILIINIFVPIAFWYDENCIYHTGFARILNHGFQLVMFLIVTIYMAIIAHKTKDNVKRRHIAIGVFSANMVLFIILQNLYVEMPFFSIGYMLGICVLHTFVLEDEKEARREQLESILQIEQMQEMELNTTRKMAYTDPLTGFKNKMSYIEDVGGVDQKIEDGFLSNFGLVVFDVNDLKKVNDSLGHDAGDNHIKKACEIIASSFKHSPVYRIGGDEFVAFLRGTDYKNHKAVLKKFNSIVEKNQKNGDVVISCGFAEYDSEKDKSYLRLFERADQEMYKRKQALKANKKTN